MANACRLGVGLGAVCADVVESLSAILKRAYNDHSGRGGGGMRGVTQLEREGEVVLQVWLWWFLKFDLPLRNYGTPHTAPCTMAKLMATRSTPPSNPCFPSASFVFALPWTRRQCKRCCRTCFKPTIEPWCGLLVHACLCVPIKICGELLTFSRLI